MWWVFTWPFDGTFEFLNQCQSLLCAKCSCQLLTTLDKLLPAVLRIFLVTKDPELRIPFNDCFVKIQLIWVHTHSEHCTILWGVLSLFRSSADENSNHRFSAHYRFTLCGFTEHWKLFQKSALCSCYLVSVAVSLRRTHNTAHWGNELANPFFACRGRENTLFPIINCCSGCAFYAITFSFVH